MKNTTQIAIVIAILIWLSLFVSFLSSKNKEGVEINRILEEQNIQLKKEAQAEKESKSKIETIQYPYLFDVLGWYWDDRGLENLWRFSAENLDDTLVELGLK